MEFCTIHKEALDKETIKKKINQGIDVHFKMPNKDILAIRRSNDLHFLMKEPVDLIFRNVYSGYKDNIIFHNHITIGIVKDVIHSFHVTSREKSRLFPNKKKKPEFCSAIHSKDDVNVEQTVFVVIDFNNH